MSSRLIPSEECLQYLERLSASLDGNRARHLETELAMLARNLGVSEDLKRNRGITTQQIGAILREYGIATDPDLRGEPSTVSFLTLSGTPDLTKLRRLREERATKEAVEAAEWEAAAATATAKREAAEAAEAAQREGEANVVEVASNGDHDRPSFSYVERDADRALLLWVAARLTVSNHEDQAAPKFDLADLVNRRGHSRAERRLRASGVREVACFLAEHGFIMEPDYQNIDKSPGIGTEVTLSFDGTSDKEDPKGNEAIAEAKRIDDQRTTPDEFSPNVEAPRPSFSYVESDADRALLLWVAARLSIANHEDLSPPRFDLADLVNRRGHSRADKRLRASGVQEIANFLAEHGFTMEPDYRNIDKSPGIGAEVTLRFDGASNGELHIVEGILSLAVAVAKADERIDPDEHTHIVELAHSRLVRALESGPRPIQNLIESLMADSIDVIATATKLQSWLSLNQRERLMEHLFDIAIADGILEEREEFVLVEIQHALGADKRTFDRFLRLCKVAHYGSSSDSNRKPEPSETVPDTDVGVVDEIMNLLGF